MTSPLQTQIASLATTFATSVLKAIRAASLDDILAETSGHDGAANGRRSTAPAPALGVTNQAAAAQGLVKRGPGRPRKNFGGPAPQPARVPRKGKPGRLPRRSAEDIAKALDRVVAHVKSNKQGLRAEQIREQLGMDRKELPRVLKEGLSKKVLRSKGQKRSTTYSA